MIDRPGVCALAHSSQISDDILQAAKTELRRRFNGDCQLIPGDMEDPFSNAARVLWKDASFKSLLGFWIDVEAGGSDLLTRGIELGSLLEWGQKKNSTSGLSADSILKLIQAQVSDVLDQFPFAGFVDPDGFVCWADHPDFIASAIRLDGFHRHPFLPSVLDPKVIPLKDALAEVKEVEGGNWKFQWKNISPKVEGRLWIQEMAGK